MIEWTESARKNLDEYCARSKTSLAGTGADIQEVVDDLRRHVVEEIRAGGLSVVTEEDVRRVLARLGEPGAPAVERRETAPIAEPSSTPVERKRPGYTLLVMGVIFPVITLAFELLTGISAGVLFDPLPSWFHVLAVALVPGANLWIWLAGRARDGRHAQLLGWLNGAALGVCCCYSLLYLPFAPVAGMAIIAFGAGLIPLTPHLALLATPILRIAYKRRMGCDRLPGVWGALASFVVLALLQMPTALTYYGLAQASAEDGDVKSRGVRLLRSFGDDELILRACYGLLRRDLNFDLVRSLASSDRVVSADQAREIYYRVKGQPFNSVTPPALYTRMGRWSALEEEFAWDDALGGETVAGQVKGLSLLNSRMDAAAEPDASLVYCEWTLEFKNVSTQQREARAQIALPPEAVVSRVTLWISGEEREAAFGGRSQVREAYQDVAVTRRRDPVLVTSCGPDRVLVQCFPVPPNGGAMKLRLGITAPLQLASLDQGRFVWPRFLERNFRIAPDLKHALWIESPGPMSRGTNAPITPENGAPRATFHEEIAETSLSSSLESIQIHRSSAAEVVWTPSEAEGQIILQTLQPVPGVPPTRLVVVVDGTEGMRQYIPDIVDALSETPDSTEIAMIVASDTTGEQDARPRKATPSVLSEIRRSLTHTRFVGGQDNLAALAAAWDLADAADRGAVLWIHQPQPALLSGESALRQRIERTLKSTRLFDFQVRNGPNRILEKLDGLGAVEQVLPLASTSSGLRELLDQWRGREPEFKLVRERATAPPAGVSGRRVGRHIERLWAREEAMRLASEQKRDEAIRLAAGHQLVTPLTGAVVLETKEQYDTHNLKPADPMTVPAIPEPGVLSVVAVGIAVLLAWRPKPRQPFWRGR